MSQEDAYSTSEAIQSTKHKVLIDTDIGDDIDDALALAVALNSPEIELQAVTTVFGDTRRRAQLAAQLLAVSGREDIPVAAGVEIPLLPRHRPSGVPQAALIDERTNFAALNPLSGPELLVQLALAHSGQLTLLCIGPLTNVAMALTLEPRIFMAIRRIILMGGTSSIPFAEWNIRSDAWAAQIVLRSGIPITMLGWNVTTRCQLKKSDIEQLHTCNTPQAEFLSKLLAVWQRHRPRWHPTLPYLHDPLTVVALCRPELLRFKEMTVRVFTRKPLRGYMVPRVFNGPFVRAAVDVQAGQAREWIAQRLLAAP